MQKNQATFCPSASEIQSRGRVWAVGFAWSVSAPRESDLDQRFFFASLPFGSLFVKACPMLIARAFMQQLQQSQQLQQPEGWRFAPDTILLGYQWASSWVPVRTLTVHWGPISGKAVGGLITVQHSGTEFNTAVTRRRNTANMVAEQCRSRARTLGGRALLTRVCCGMTGPRNEEPIELMHEDFQGACGL